MERRRRAGEQGGEGLYLFHLCKFRVEVLALAHGLLIHEFHLFQFRGYRVVRLCSRVQLLRRVF